MDKYEYKVRVEEIHNLISEQEYARAVEIADTIDWRRVKSIKTLCTISDLYKINRRYQESKEILLMAYERYPGGRLIVYSLCELSIKLEEYVQAIEYYKEYVQLAPKDTNRYILQYRLYEAQDVSIEERIEVLEEFKRKDYREKWGYELAYLYHRMGLASKCVDECDELIVTFGEGRYIIKAMELKMLHEPLTAAEQYKYDEWMRERDEEIIEERRETYGVTGETVSDVPYSTDEADLTGAPTTEMPQDMDIKVKTVDVGQYNTTNLQEALAESMRDIWGDDDTDAHTPSAPQEDAEDNTLFGTGPLAGPMYAQDPQSYNADNWNNTGDLPVSQMPLSQDNAAYAVDNWGYSADRADNGRSRVVEAADIPVAAGMQEYKAYESFTEDVPGDETKRIPTEAVVDYLGAQTIRKQMQQESAAFTASDARTDNIPGAMTGEISLPVSENSAYDGILTQEYDGQISFALPDSEQLEKQITGQLSIEDIMSEWENTKKENEEKRKAEVKQRILQHTGSIFDEFADDTKAGLLEQLERAFREAIDKEAQSGKINSKELNDRISREARRAAMNVAAAQEAELEDEANEDAEPIAESGQKETEPADKSDKESEVMDEELPEEEEADTDKEEQEDRAEVKAVMQALAEDDEEEPAADKDAAEPAEAVAESDEERGRTLSDEEEEFFAPYLTRRSTRRQLSEALDNMSLASYTGNIIVTGEEGVGTLDLSKRLIKQLQTMDSNFLGQVAKISGKALNGKDIDNTLVQLKNGALMIERARGMKKSTVEKLMKALEKEDMGILVLLEDTAEGIDRIVKVLPKLKEIFNVRIDLHALDNKALVNYAREYALSKEYSIDEFGVLALHTRIEEMQTSDHQVTVAEVRELVDDAIYYAERKTPAHLLDVVFHKRYDSDDMIVLREKDFMHY